MKINAIRLFFISVLAATGCGCSCDNAGLTLIPPQETTDKVVLDIRGGIRNDSGAERRYKVCVRFDSEIVARESIRIPAASGHTMRFDLPLEGRVGEHEVTMVVRSGLRVNRYSKPLTVIASDVRSTRRIDGAFAGIYHWSEQEAKMWNPAIKTLNATQWQEMVHSMTKLGMRLIIVQETWHSEEYCGKHDMDASGYRGKAFYDSQLYPARMEVTCPDALEAILEQADREGMDVLAGVGLYAWFDYTAASLQWHKNVAKELWERYGHHPSFYGFYVSEEGMGSLDCFETDPLLKPVRKQEMISFYKEFTAFCHDMAPSKPVMVCQNGWGIGESMELYPGFLSNVDISCPFAFNRMPEGDLTGLEAVTFLQNTCNEVGCHLWFDLEAFLFDPDEQYLIPRPISEIKTDLLMFDNFEKVVCYQYPGVFSDPEASVQVGESATVELFNDYKEYLKTLLNE
ncbi:MAG: DUF4434 domain-containing protein [Bacteroidales bacterium]|nr:DUF4434 domain-containing protein [Bacteroidales bacterium]